MVADPHLAVIVAVRTVGPHQAAFPAIVFPCRFDNYMRGYRTGRVMTAVRYMLAHPSRAHPSSLAQHLTQGAKLVRAAVAQLNIPAGLRRSKRR